MTVAAKTTRVQYTGTGLVATYAYNWKILSDADLVVVRTNTAGVDTTLSMGSDYTVTGAGTDGGGNVVLSVNLTSGYLLTIYMDMDITQPDDYTNQKTAFLETMERSLDRQALISQQLAEALNRCVKLDPTSTDSADQLQALLESVDTSAQAASASAAAAAGAAATAQAAVGKGFYEETVTGSAKSTFTMPFSYDYANKAVSVFINGVYQNPSTVSCPDATHVTLDAAVDVGKTVAFSTALLGAADVSSLYADRLLSNLTNPSTARSNLGLGDSATKNVGTTAGTVCAGDDARLTGSDVIARDLAIRNAFKTDISASAASGPIPSGYMHLFLTDELATKTNATYDATGDYYTNAGTVSATPFALTLPMLSVTGFTGTLGANILDGSTSNTNLYPTPSAAAGTSIMEVNIGAGVALGKIRVYTNASIQAKVQYSSDGGSTWVDCSPVVNLTGTAAWFVFDLTFMGFSGRYRIINTSTNVNGGYWNEIDAYAYGANTNMTLTPTAITAGSAPKSIDLYMLHKAVDAVTLNTDVKARVSLDGTNWSGFATLTDLGQYDTNYKILRATVDTSGLTGTSGIKWEITTLNAKAQRVRAVAMLLNS